MIVNVDSETDGKSSEMGEYGRIIPESCSRRFFSVFNEIQIHRNLHSFYVRDFFLYEKVGKDGKRVPFIVTCSDSHPNFKVIHVPSSKVVPSWNSGSFGVINMYHYGQYFASIDLGTFLCLWKIKDVEGEEEVKFELLSQVKVAESGTCWFHILPKPDDPSHLVTGCFFGRDSKGSVTSIFLTPDRESISDVRRIHKFDEGVVSMHFSRLKEKQNILYVGGGDYKGRDFSLKKYDFDTNKFDIIFDQSRSTLYSIFSIIDTNRNVEYLICGNYTAELFLLRNEVIFRKFLLFDENAFSFTYVNERKVLFGAGRFGAGAGTDWTEDGCGNIYALEMEEDVEEFRIGRISSRQVHDQEITRILFSKKDNICVTSSLDKGMGMFRIKEIGEEEVRDLVERIDFLVSRGDERGVKFVRIKLVGSSTISVPLVGLSLL